LFCFYFSSESPDDIFNSLEAELVQKDIELEMKDVELISQKKKIEYLLMKVSHSNNKVEAQQTTIEKQRTELKQQKDQILELKNENEDLKQRLSIDNSDPMEHKLQHKTIKKATTGHEAKKDLKHDDSSDFRTGQISSVSQKTIRNEKNEPEVWKTSDIKTGDLFHSSTKDMSPIDVRNGQRTTKTTKRKKLSKEFKLMEDKEYCQANTAPEFMAKTEYMSSFDANMVQGKTKTTKSKKLSKKLKNNLMEDCQTNTASELMPKTEEVVFIDLSEHHIQDNTESQIVNIADQTQPIIIDDVFELDDEEDFQSYEDNTDHLSGIKTINDFEEDTAIDQINTLLASEAGTECSKTVKKANEEGNLLSFNDDISNNKDHLPSSTFIDDILEVKLENDLEPEIYSANMSNTEMMDEWNEKDKKAPIKNANSKQLCKICLKTFSHSSGLSRHITTMHKKMKPYQCEICSKTFGQSSHLKSHVFVAHKNEIPKDMNSTNQCKICSITFGYHSELQSHINRIHKKIKPFQCQICFQCFVTKFELEKHNKTHYMSDGITRKQEAIKINSETKCANCKTQKTDQWRRNSYGQPICNACGQYAKAYGINRPVQLHDSVKKKRPKNRIQK
jgi:hypothetical protein